MKHATDQTLDEIEWLLTEMRKLATLVERKRGIFYRRSKAFVHFHEDEGTVFGDAKLGDEFKRFRLRNLSERRRFVAAVRKFLAQSAAK